MAPFSPALRQLSQGQTSASLSRMMTTTVGVLHPGAMGAAIGACLASAGTTVLWVPTGRSDATKGRARTCGFETVESLDELVERSSMIMSICPPHAAVDVARSLPSFRGIYIDANAISPSCALTVGDLVRRAGATFVDGSIIGAPPGPEVSTRLYLSGDEAARAAAPFEQSFLDAVVLSERPGDASAVKMAYAAWTKGTQALLLASRELARASGVDDALAREWSLSQPALAAQAARAEAQSAEKGWRWVGEMEQIAAAFHDSGLPSGFHAAAAEIFRDGVGTPRAERGR